MWDDTLMMTVIPLVQIGLSVNKPSYVLEAKRQFLLHINYMIDAPSGLDCGFMAGSLHRNGR